MELYAHQKEESQLWQQPARCLLWKPRVGKSRALTATIKYWNAKAGVSRIVVTAPLIVCSDTWEAECALAKLPTYNAYSGGKAAREGQIAAWKSKGGVLLINHDVLSTYCHLLVGVAEALIVDEIHLFANHGSKRSQAAWRIGRHDVCRFRRGATGTPLTRHLGSIFSQYRILDDSIFGTAHARFADKYLLLGRYPGQVIGYKNQRELIAKMHSIASVKTREELFDVPEIATATQRLSLPVELQRVYDRLVRVHVAQIEEGGGQIVLDHALSRLTRLAQLATGFLPGGLLPEYPEDTWLWTGKTDSIVESCVEVVEADEKVVVFFRFGSQGKAIMDALALRIGQERVKVIQGSTTQAHRKIALEGLRSGIVRVLLVQEAAGSAGISLKSANYMIFASMGWSSVVHEQAKDRTWEAQNAEGTVKKFIEYFETAGTIDGYIRKRITDKESFQNGAMNAKEFKKAAYGE